MQCKFDKSANAKCRTQDYWTQAREGENRIMKQICFFSETAKWLWFITFLSSCQTGLKSRRYMTLQ